MALNSEELIKEIRKHPSPSHIILRDEEEDEEFEIDSVEYDEDDDAIIINLERP